MLLFSICKSFPWKYTNSCRSNTSWLTLSCKQKVLLEEMLNLFHNILNKLINLLRAIAHVCDGTAFQT
jgi:hypothetical protein